MGFVGRRLHASGARRGDSRRGQIGESRVGQQLPMMSSDST